jgi:phosphopantetheine--protein transferase-like protein
VLALICGVGTDIVAVARFEKISERFIERCFTPGEREYLRGKPLSSSAGLFAAKEAVVKALGTGFSGFWPVDVEVTHDANGRPGVTLHGKARDIADSLSIDVIWLSISHSEANAVAFAVAERAVGYDLRGKHKGNAPVRKRRNT